MKKELYLVDMGILIDKYDKDFEYYGTCYGIEEYHLYDENMWLFLKEDFEKEKTLLKQYINKLVNNTYFIITKQGLWDIEENDCFSDLDISYCDFLRENVVYSIMKDKNGNIIENFIH